MRLTAKQEAFAVAIAKGASSKDAYRAAYDTSKMTAKSIGELASHALRHRKISARLNELLAPALRNTGLSIERSLLELARVAYGDAGDFINDDDTIKPRREWTKDMSAAIASLEVHEQFVGEGEDRKLVGRVKKLKLWDKNAALVSAMRHLGMFEKDNKQLRENLAIQINFVGSPREGEDEPKTIGNGKAE